MNAIATEIYNQLGAKALFMLGAKNIGYSTNYLSFQIRGSKSYSHIRITLDADDTYSVKFFKIRKFDIVKEKTLSGVYCDMLHQIIESETGLYTTINFKLTHVQP